MMHLPIIIAGLAAIANLATAQYFNSSGPFNLVLESRTNKTLNGRLLVACDLAASQLLCIDKPVNSYQLQFNYNYTDIYNDKTGSRGELTYNPGHVDGYPLQFSYDPGTNVAFPFFSNNVGNVQVTFDEDDYFLVVADKDDTVTPPVRKSVYFNRWYMCVVHGGDYHDFALSWVMGDRKPQNPSCEAVKVKRVFPRS